MLNALKNTLVRARDWAYALPAPPVLRSLGEFVFRVIRNFGRHDGPHAAAGIAYYALFSLFPLLLGTLAVAGVFIGTEAAQEQLIAFLDSQVPGLGQSDVLQNNIRGVVEARGLMGSISALSLFWAGRAIFIALRRICNRAWEVVEKPHFLIVQVTNFLSTLAIAALFLLSLFAGTAGRALLENAQFLDRLGPIDLPLDLFVSLVPFLFALAVFLVIYRFVPDTKVSWRAALAGALPAAVLLEALKFGFSLYLSEFANFEQVYGGLSTVIITLFGFFLTAQIFVIGAEISSEYARSRGVGLLRFNREQFAVVRGGLAPETERRKRANAGQERKQEKTAAGR